MASTVLSGRNESSWGQSLYSNNLNPNPNPNPKSIPKKKKLHALGGGKVTAPEDAYSFNQRSMEWNSDSNFNRGEYVTFNIGSYTRSELIELKKRLVAEREQIWKLNDRIDSGKIGRQFPGKFKKLSGNKRPIPFVSGKDPKRLCETTSDNGIGIGIGNASEIGDSMKMCRQVLTKLLKHKLSWIFNKPVDAVAMGLHDYHQIIKRPMDLGTVKSNFAKNLYALPEDFAADVRLTFNNAMLYNPKGDEVHKMAEQLLARFEELYRPIQEKYEGDQKQRIVLSDELQGSSWSRIPTPERTKKLKSNSMQTSRKHDKVQRPEIASKKSKSNSMPTAQKQEKMQVPVSATNPTSSSNPQSLQSPTVPTPSPVQAPPVKPAVVRANPGKQPKPKAKDPNKRQMSMEEKHRLSVGLQSLPQEKMPQLVQIMKKRNSHWPQEEDEIELDIEAIDLETLWELDRFVTNWKKMVSKNKRQALIGNNNSAAATASGEDNALSVSEKTDTVKKLKKGEGGEEEVDIGDEMPMSSFPPVEIEKDDGGRDNGHASSSSSSSSSSGSDSSSSSDSDSGSSSGSDSDADDAQSRGLKSKELSKT